jgi:hypothetical protein
VAWLRSNSLGTSRNIAMHCPACETDTTRQAEISSTDRRKVERSVEYY